MHIEMSLKNKWLILLGMLSMGMSEQVFAAPFGCAIDRGAIQANYTVNFGTITIQQDSSIPNGTVLATQTTPSQNTNIAYCYKPYMYTYLLKYAGAAALGNNIYSTNVPGIGIRTQLLRMFAVRPSNYYKNNVTGPIHTGQGDGRDYSVVEIIKTGNISAGTLNGGIIGSIQYSPRTRGAPYIDAYNVYLGTAVIRIGSCTVKNTNINVPLGRYLKRDFHGVGSLSVNKNFTIPLSCNAGTKVHMRIDAAADGSGAPGVIALTSNKSKASGIGVQVLLSDGTTPVTLGKTLDLPTATVAGNYNVNMQARYYQTQKTVTPGTANAMATFTMTYR
jgi:type 1 fimbria pilin